MVHAGAAAGGSFKLSARFLFLSVIFQLLLMETQFTYERKTPVRIKEASVLDSEQQIFETFPAKCTLKQQSRSSQRENRVWKRADISA